jgi:alkanesulfonate monooxygenase SsuD/methylene tetrahydromethanopterin reductase-like flavin-dependent oxidoreductase (luciferase family)
VNPFKFGALLIPNVPWDVLLERARTLETLGVDTIWVDDHIANPQRPEQPWFDAFSVLAALAQATSSVGLGPMVSNAVLRHPALLARQALSVDHVAHGRLVLGLGAGYAPTDHRFVQQPVPSTTDRAARFRETVRTVDALLRGGAAVPGSYIDVADLALAPASLQTPRPPIYVAAHHPASLATAAAFGDGWVSFGGWALTLDELLERTRRRNASLDRLALEHGREPDAIRRVLLAGSGAVCRDPMWTSVSVAENVVERCRDAGIDELVVYYPPSAVSRDVEPGVFETVVRELVPRWRVDER